MTSIRIGSETYSLQDSVSGATLNDLKRLQAQTKDESTPDGVTPQSIQEMFLWLEKRAKEDDFEQIELLGNGWFIQNLIGVMFLARRKSGEFLEVSDAGDVAFTDIQFVDEDDEVDAAPLGEAANPEE